MSEKEQIGEYLDQSWNNLEKFEREFLAGRYTDERGIEKQTELYLEIDAWDHEMLLQIKVEMLHTFLRINF